MARGEGDARREDQVNMLAALIVTQVTLFVALLLMVPFLGHQRVYDVFVWVALVLSVTLLVTMAIYDWRLS